MMVASRMRGKMLTSPVGVFLYLVLRNDYSWSLMSENERRTILSANQAHNTERDDYVNPRLYNGGQCFDLEEDRSRTTRGAIMNDFLDKQRPRSVIEIGPGSGYFTRQIVEHPAVRVYTAIDINRNFLDYLQPRLEKVADSKPMICDLVAGDFMRIQDIRAQAVILLSAVHHIPNRRELFSRIAHLLEPGGRVLAIDPSHYLPRIRTLLRKCFKGNYLDAAYRADIRNLSTHHFCTLGEYRRICRVLPQLRVSEHVTFHQSGAVYGILDRVGRLLGLRNATGTGAGFVDRLWSREISVELERTR